MKINKADLYDLYWNQHKSALEIAVVLGCGATTVYRLMQKYDIKRRTMSEALTGKFIAENSPRFKSRGKCLHCGIKMDNKRIRKFCSEDCYHRYVKIYNPLRKRIKQRCAHCNEIISIQPNQLKGKKNLFCSQICMGKYYSDISTKVLDELNKDPLIKAKQLKGRKLNKLESKVNNILQKYFPYEWKYTGNGGVIISGLCPDFMNCNGKKKIIEVFGDRFHDPSKTFLKKVPWKQQEFGRTAIFSQFGYDTLVLWQSEIEKLSEQEIVDIIKRFL